MIDIYPIILTTVSTALTGIAKASNSEQLISENFPYVTVEEVSNITYTRSQDDSLMEHEARVGYAINVYSKESDVEARSIMSIVDTTMQNMKFTRVQMRPTPNIDRTVHRYTAMYEAVVAALNEDDVYQMYRR